MTFKQTQTLSIPGDSVLSYVLGLQLLELDLNGGMYDMDFIDY